MHVESVNIYVLVDPRDNDVRYVGKTGQSLKRRLSDHCRQDRPDTSRKGRWISKLLRMGYRPSIQLLQCVAENDSHQKTHDMEKPADGFAESVTVCVLVNLGCTNRLRYSPNCTETYRAAQK